MSIVNLGVVAIIVGAIIFGFFEGIKSQSLSLTLSCSILTAVTLFVAYLLVPRRNPPPPKIKKGRIQYSDVFEKVK